MRLGAEPMCGQPEAGKTAPRRRGRPGQTCHCKACFSFASGNGCFHYVLMVVETLGDAFAAGWRLTARCAWGKREGMKTKRECHYTRELDLETLVWTRGPNFPLSSLDGRLMCPRCRSRRVAVLFQPPTSSNAAKG
jgi:hypothetical protein